MRLEDKLEELLAPTIETMGFELWGIEYLPAGRHTVLRVFIEQSEQGVTVDDCAMVSRQISALMDVEDPISSAYTLEVSSPGMDRLLLKPEHFKRYQGRNVQVRTSMSVLGRKRFKGPMCQVGDTAIEVEVDGERYEIEYAWIEKANVVADF